jgi:hypothetical protein
MNDLESLFWEFFWICIHYNGPDEEGMVVPRRKKWNYADTGNLATMKLGWCQMRTFSRDHRAKLHRLLSTVSPLVSKSGVSRGKVEEG